MSTPLRPRRLALTAGAILVSLVAAACGGSDKGSSASSATTAASGSPTPAAASATTAAPTTASVDLSGVKLTIGVQTNDYSALVDASGVLKDLPYKLTWAVLSGPAAQLSALYSKATDVGLMGETSLIFEQGNSDKDWYKDGPPLQIIAGFSTPKAPLPTPATFVRTSANVNSLSDLKGKKWSYNFGGNVYGQYIMSLNKAGLTPKDIQPVQLPDAQTAGAAFVNGDVDVYSGTYLAVKPLIDSGQAKVLLTNQDVGVVGGYALTARSDVLADAGKVAALRDLLSRLRTFYADWYPANPDKVQQIEQDVAKQDPARARLTWENGQGGFYKLSDPAFVAKMQRIADLTNEAGSLKHKVDVSIGFNPIFDDAAVVDSAG